MKSVKSVLAIAVLGTCSTFSATALADGHCLDGNTATCITEKEISIFGNPAVEYTIDNNSGERLFSFGVTNTTPFANTSTFNLGWNGQYIDKKSWDYGRFRFSFWDDSSNSQQMTPASKIWISGTGEFRLPKPPPGGRPEVDVSDNQRLVVKNVEIAESEIIVVDKVKPVYLGSFESLFGSEENNVAFFWNAFEQDTPLNDGVELDNFFLDANPRSDFSTFGAQGNVITTSVAAVPEPETYAMFLAGLGLMAFMARRKQS